MLYVKLRPSLVAESFFLRHSRLSLPSGCWAVGFRSLVLGGLLLCWMALLASEVYRLTAGKLRQVCSHQELDTSGPVRSLWQRLADHIKSNRMESSGDENITRTSIPTDLVHNVVEPFPPNSGYCSHGGCGDRQTAVFSELLRQVSPLFSEEPEIILHLFVRLEEIHDLGLVDDRVFVTRILPLVSGNVFDIFMGLSAQGRQLDKV